MANGVLITQAEFYEDSEKYTGDAGSATNMYVIQDVYDLCAATIQSCHYELVDNIDFNDHDTYRYGVSNLIFGVTGSYICSLHGNNYKIRNLIIKNSSESRGIFSGTISDVIFENLVVINSTTAHLFYSFRAGMIVSNVRIGGYLFNSASSVVLYGANINFTDCSFNLKGLTTDGIYGNTTGAASSRTFTRCHINCDITTTSTECINFDYCDVYDSYITGRIKQIGTGFANGTRNKFIGNGSYYNSYFAVEATCDTDGFTGYDTPYLIAGTVCFMDKDLVPDIETGVVSNFYYLTEEQAKDPEYLLSINFPVVPID